MNGAHVLVVDDEPGVVALCRRMLTRAGYRVTAVTSTAEALEALEQPGVDLLLVDVRMPGMDGFELMRKAKSALPDLAVVVMTGFGTVETAIRALEEGASGLVLKPFDSNEAVIRQIERAIEVNRTAREAARSRALRPLFDVAEVLFSETEEAALAQRVAGAVQAQLGCTSAGVYLLEPASNAVRTLAWLGEQAEDGERVARGPIDWAIEQRAIVRVSGEAVSDETRKAWLEAHRVGSALACPLRRSEGTYVFYAGRGKGSSPFTEVDAELLYLLSRQAALALENARLYGALRAYVAEIEASQQRLLQSEKLAAIGRLTASIAHEVNNPLQSLRNCLELATRDDLAPERRAEYLRLALRELQNLGGVVRQMLEFYRPEAATRQVVDLNRIVQDVAMLTASQCEERKVVLELDLPAELPSVWGVPYQLQQVAMNLMLNALEAMPGGGRLLVRIERRSQDVALVIQDTGRGIPKADLSRVFEPFYTLKQSGTGLGLAISYGIVAAHDGVIQVESDLGVGTTFTVAFPHANAVSAG